jgi:hypothetical protein
MLLPFTSPLFGAGDTTLAVVSSSSYLSTTSRTTHTINRPADTQAGDLLLWFGAGGGSSTAPATLPDGWTIEFNLYENDLLIRHTVFAYKTIQSGEASTYTMTLEASAGWTMGIVALRNGTFSRISTALSNSSSLTAAVSLLSVPGGAALIHCSACANSSSRTSTPATNYTEIMDLGAPTGGSGTVGGFQFSQRLPAPSGNTGTVRNTWSSQINGTRAVLIEVT